MSLFGNLGSGSQPTSGAGGTSAPGTAIKPLFGGSTASAPTSNLFPSLGSSSTAQPAASQPASTGGGIGGLFNKPAPLATTGASGFSLGGTSTAQPKPAFPGLFNASAGQAQQSTTTTANPLSLGQTTTAGQSTLFNNSTAAQPSQQSGLGQSTNAGNGTGRSAHFDHLLERGKKRNAGENGLASFEELPSLQLGLGDIARKVRNIGAGGPSADQGQDRVAHYLLSASGVKLGSTLRDLNQFSTQAGVSTAGRASDLLDTDVDGYISSLHSHSTLALIQDGLEQSKRDFDTFLEENVQIEWDAQRKRIYEHFGLGKQSEDFTASQSTFSSTAARGAFGRSTRKGRSVGPKAASTNAASFGASGAPPVLGSVMSPYQKRALNGTTSPEKSAINGHNAPTRDVREKQEKFIEKVKELNINRQEEKTFPVLHSFQAVEKSIGTDNQDYLVNAYGALISIVGENDMFQLESGATNPRARSFAPDYLDSNPNSVNSIRNRKRILDGSRKFLEKKFLAEANEAVRNKANEARPGGIPSLESKIRGYVSLKVQAKELGDLDELQKIGEQGDEYPWVLIFYFLRAGLAQEAAEYVRGKRNFFQNNDRVFAAAIAHYAEDPDRRLTPDLQSKITHVYSQRARIAPTNDPYRMACYKLIGRCELTRRNLEPLQQGMDDWVWLQFNLAREGNRAEENAGEIFGLEEIRASIDDVGRRHFKTGSDAAGSYGVYFYLATLAGMFEDGINFLYDNNYVSAVHFAIGLDYYGLLRVASWSTAGQQTLHTNSREQPEINFGRIVGIYTADFRAGNAGAAAEYLILICLNADLPGGTGDEQAALCHEALRELVLETREFSTLLGDVKANGTSTQGLLQERISLIKLLDDNALIKKITQEAARTADDNGRTNDAVLLNHLAGEYDNVVTILNRALSEALSVDLGQAPLKLEPLKQRLPGPEAQISDPNSTSLSLLGTDDPMDLSDRVVKLYDSNPLWWRSVTKLTRDTMWALFKLNEAKKVIEAGRYMEALDIIHPLDILPLSASGNLSQIRASANNFSSFPPEVARNIGNVLLWCIMCCSRHREVLLGGQFEDPTRKALADQLLQKAKDLMVFAGLIRYKLPPRVFETLAREGQDVGAY